MFEDWLYTARWFALVKEGKPVESWVASYREPGTSATPGR